MSSAWGRGPCTCVPPVGSIQDPNAWASWPGSWLRPQTNPALEDKVVGSTDGSAARLTGIRVVWSWDHKKPLDSAPRSAQGREGAA